MFVNNLKIMATSILFPLLVIWFASQDLAQAKVSVSIDKLNLTLGNNFFSASFNSSATATAILINGQNIVFNVSGIVGDKGAQKSFYLDYHEDTEIFFAPSDLKVVNQTDDFAHVVYIQDSEDAMYLELHYIITSDVSGLYQYVVAKNDAKRNISIAELRVVCRFNSDLMEYINNGKIHMKVPKYRELMKYKKVQDETWLLPDGTYYTKYDLAGYVRERHYYGVLGGGYGAWIIHPSHEYFSGGPLKQDIIGHQDSLMIVYMTGAHFGTPTLITSPGYVKFYGPWLIYFNQGSNDQLVEDVKNQTKLEIAKWPYSFVHDTLYPLSRGAVTGTVKGAKSMVIISPQHEACDQQVEGYSYSNETVNGKFTIKDIRPGNYLLSVYPLEGASAGTLIQRNITVTANKTTSTSDLDLAIEEPQHIVWQIGETNRQTTKFRYSNESRNYKWMLLPPANITFEIGKSSSEKDWYYAQVRPGFWDVQFEETNDDKNRSLLLSLAGASSSGISAGDTPKITIYLNEHKIQSFTYESDHSIYRSALKSGVYHFEKIEIPAELVLSGRNKLSIELVEGAVMYDCLVYHRTNAEARPTTLWVLVVLITVFSKIL